MNQRELMMKLAEAVRDACHSEACYDDSREMINQLNLSAIIEHILAEQPSAGLTDEDVLELADKHGNFCLDIPPGEDDVHQFTETQLYAFARAIEQRTLAGQGQEPVYCMNGEDLRNILLRLREIDRLLNSPDVHFESIREVQREKTAIFDGLDGLLATPLSVSDVSEMVNRFLGWKLPRDFGPDAGISFVPPNNPEWWPVGTNLFTATQARQMFEYVLAAPRQEDQP